MKPHRRVVENLLAWFSQAARDLPWRRTRDPYAIWVSEIMLQQTQVKTVIPYYERWLAALPDVHALAVTPPDRVLKLWEGLGYYSRVRNLQAAARIILEKHGGAFPRDLDAWLALPGIGRYTAGAILSIAFNQPAPILDGNVMRVLTRLRAWRGDPRQGALNRQLWTLAGEMVTAAVAIKRPQASSHFNQSLMELGATVCTPSKPHCPTCPIRRDCRARRLGRVEDFPEIRRKTPTVAQRRIAFVVQRRGRWLVQRRKPDGLNGGLWEFPNFVWPEKTSAAAIARRHFGALRFVHQATLPHTITRHRITLEVYQAAAEGAGFRKIPGTAWKSLREMRQLAFAAVHRKILTQLARV